MTAGSGTASGEDVFRQLQSIARSDGAGADKPAPTSEYLTRHGLESFLDRLARTPHAKDFVLKGGILLAVYGVRRPTKDVDAEAINSSVTAAHIERVVREVAAVAVDDGVVFDVAAMTVQEIRETAEYPGLRVGVKASIGQHSVTVAWDISSGDPIVPLPTLVKVPRVLGEPIVMLGYAPETIVAEKGVTILERGITSTRWRDYVDIVRLAEEHGLDQDLLLDAAQAVARYRQVALGPIAAVVVGYGALGQAKWAAWRRKESLEDISEAKLDDQMAEVAAVLDPVFSRASAA
jgi:hypothetical protein